MKNRKLKIRKTGNKERTMKRTGNRKMRIAVTAALCVAAIGIGTTAAYFTDGDSVTNRFTVGKVSIELTEPNWTGPVQNITPNQEIKKDPKITNDGVNDAFVFLEVIVPYEKIATANLDGTKNAAADTDLFTYTVNNGWVQVGADAKDAEKKTITRVYAYASAGACTKLKAKENTPTLFDTVRFCNALEDQSLEESGKEIVVNGYAIQATDIGDESGSKTAPADVWSVLSKQNPSLTK